MLTPQYNIETKDDSAGANTTNETVKVDDEALTCDEVVRLDKKKDQERIHEQEIVRKAIVFWHHPLLRDISPAEKRFYLHDQLGLTNAQVYKVWEELVREPGAEVDKNGNNCFYSRIAGRNNVSDNHRQHFYQQSSHFPTEIINGQSRSIQIPCAQSSTPKIDSDHGNHMTRAQKHIYIPLSNENKGLMEGLDGPCSIVRGIFLLGVGGLLGVTGAAAVRWLNGGRFELIPPPSLNDSIDLTNTSRLSRIKPLDMQGTEEHAASFQNLDDSEEFDLEICLSEKIDALLTSVDSNSVLLERLILKLNKTSTITDDSMNFLKQNTEYNNGNPNNIEQPHIPDKSCGEAFLSAQLKGIKGDLSTFWESVIDDGYARDGNENAMKKNRRKEWSGILAKFDKCLQIIEKSFIVDPDATDSKSLSSSETSVTENEAQQDAQSSLVCPSRPTAGTEKKSQINSPTLIPLSLEDCILKIVQNNDTMCMKSGSQLLYLYLTNLSEKPNNRRYRKIFTSNESFQRLRNMKGGKDLLLAVGFVEDYDKGTVEWVPTGSAEEEISALVLVNKAAAALGILKKSECVPPSELVHTALSKFLSPSSSVSGCHQSFLPLNVPNHKVASDGNSSNSHHTLYDRGATPQTPSGSSLSSPPLPKKMSFVPSSSDVC